MNCGSRAGTASGHSEGGGGGRERLEEGVEDDGGAESGRARWHPTYDGYKAPPGGRLPPVREGTRGDSRHGFVKVYGSRLLGYSRGECGLSG